VLTALVRFEQFAEGNTAGQVRLPVTYVLTNRSAAAALIFSDAKAQSFEGSDGDLPAWVFMATGAVVGNSAKGAGRHSSSPRGNCLWQVVDPDSGLVLAWGICDKVPDLSTLGQVVHSPP
jgi:hypothetical protein